MTDRVNIASLDTTASVGASDRFVVNISDVTQTHTADLISDFVLKANAVSGDAIAGSAITAVKLAEDTVDSQHMALAAITGDHIAGDQVGSQHYANASITADHILNDAIDSQHLALAAVTGDHIVGDSVDSQHIAPSAVTADMIASEAVTNTKLQEDLRVLGKQTIGIPGAAWRPTATSGCAAVSNIDKDGATPWSATKPTFAGLAFGQTTDEYAYFVVDEMPRSWDEGSVSLKMTMHVGLDVVERTIWEISGVAISSGGTMTADLGTAGIMTIDAIGGTADVVKSSETGFTIGGTPTTGDMVSLRVGRQGSNLNDTMTSDANLIGATMFMTIDRANDT